MPKKINTDILQGLITGRTYPHIYAFTTETVPNYLKVGDTFRPVQVRLDEWRKKYRNLRHVYTESARIDDNLIFRDHSVHKFLESEKGRARISDQDFPDRIYRSNEFFKNATTADVDDAIADIRLSAACGSGKYTLYTSDHLPHRSVYERGGILTPRDNQQKVIDNFMKAVDSGRTNLLMYAVMRFGKSFTSMCCAQRMGARTVLVVSAKADVADEWKRTVEGIGNFSEYIFATKSELQSDQTFITDTLSTGKSVVLFLTLQDLQGKDIKAAHKEVFGLESWNLVIVDETHFGARAAHYGEVLRRQKESNEAKRQLADVDTLDKLNDQTKYLKSRVKLHLSGTPYRILMGSEFDKEDVVAFVQFSDIAAEKDKWDAAHRYDEEKDECDNPYFGFPKMIRFAFTPDRASLQRLEELKSKGATASFSELFRPVSLVESNQGHKEFVHPDVVLDFLKVIDGSKADDNVLGFLDNDLIKQGKLCRHMVLVLPYCASCDAMEQLIKANSDSFLHLGDYEIVNISGLHARKRFNDTAVIKRHIAECEAKGIKTITLTVNRMLTGNTVPQWDTMLFLKECSSPEEYDQAIYRLQNPFVDEYTADDGKTVKVNLKPETILIDFNPERVFRLQEHKSKIYNANTDSGGNSRLKERIGVELRVSPIITLDHNMLREVTATNIMDAVRRYDETRSILDEASALPVDPQLLDNGSIVQAIGSLRPISLNKGITEPATKIFGDGDDVGMTLSDEERQEQLNTPEIPSPACSDDGGDNLEKQLSSYFALILFFAFLTEDKVRNLQDILSIIDKPGNNRIKRNLGLSTDILRIINDNINSIILNSFDYTIENINQIARDPDKTPTERVRLALTKFGRMSESEIVTPERVAKEMVDNLPEDVFTEGGNILDIASKQGEFAFALINRFGPDIAPRIYAVCTSPLAYEFTRKVYSLLDMPAENVFSSFTTTDLRKPGNQSFMSILTNIGFKTILGNPPYNENNGGGKSASSGVSVYPIFFNIATEINPHLISYIIPSRWYSGGNIAMDNLRKSLGSGQLKFLRDFPTAGDCFDNVEIKGGVCFFNWIKSHSGDCIVEISEHGKISETSIRPVIETDNNVVIRYSLLNSINNKVKQLSATSFSDIVSANDPFGFDQRQEGSMKRQGIPTIKPTESHAVPLYYNGWRKRGLQFVNELKIRRNKGWSPLFKVLIPKSWGVGNIKKDRIQPFLVEGKSCCTETYLVVGPFADKKTPDRVIKYMSTKFFHAMVFVAKNTQNSMQSDYRFVPMQDFTDKSDIDWTQSVENIDEQLYEKYGLTDEERDFIKSMIRDL